MLLLWPDLLGEGVPWWAFFWVGALLVFWAQYSVYIKAVASWAEERSELKTKLERLKSPDPDIDPRLEYLGSKLRLTEETVTRREMKELFQLDPKADHLLVVRLRSKVEIKDPALLIECDGPIYDVGSYWAHPGEEPIFTMEVEHKSPDRVWIPFLTTPLPTDTRWALYLSVQSPTHLRRVAIGSFTPPADPPRSTAAGPGPPSSPGSSEG